MGKNKPIYDPSHDIGDYVVVTNARHIKVTGKKDQQKIYRHHSMFPGGLKEVKYEDLLQKRPEEVSQIRIWGIDESILIKGVVYRSFGKQYQVCYPRINSEIEDWRDYWCFQTKSTHIRQSESSASATDTSKLTLLATQYRQTV